MKSTIRQQQKEQTRALLLRTAYDVFSERGIMNTRMSDIAQAAGLSHGAVFVHFPTREALIEETVEAYGGQIAARTHALADDCGSLDELLRAHLDGISAFEPFYTRLVIENRLLPTGARDSWMGIQSAISFHFARVAKQRAVPPHMLFNLWIGLVHHYLAYGDLFAPEGNVLKRHGDTLIQSFMALLPARGEVERHG